MNVKELEELARLMKEYGLSCLEYAQGETSVKLKRGGAEAEAPLAAAGASPFTAAPAEGLSQQTSQKEGAWVLSPTVGVFYSSPSPEAKPYVEVGSRVKKGDILCVIEAMKLMNEIPAETDGVIAEICVTNGQVIEFGQPLFRIVNG